LVPGAVTIDQVSLLSAEVLYNVHHFGKASVPQSWSRPLLVASTALVSKLTTVIVGGRVKTSQTNTIRRGTHPAWHLLLQRIVLKPPQSILSHLGIALCCTYLAKGRCGDSNRLTCAET